MQTNEDSDILEVDAGYTGDDTPIPDPVVTPQEVVPPPIITDADIAAIRAHERQKVLAEIESQRQAPQSPQAPVAPAIPAPDLPDEFYQDPHGYVQRQVAAQVQHQVGTAMQQVMPYVQRSASNDVVDRVARDMSVEAQDYIRNVAQGISNPSQVTGPVEDLLRRAARDVDNEVRAKQSRTRIEPAVSEPKTVKIDEQAFRENNADRVRMGAKPWTAAEFAKHYGS